MIPKVLPKESGFQHSGFPLIQHVGPPLTALDIGGQAIPQSFVPGHRFLPENVVMQTNSDIDSLLQVHRRKMLRRAANRRSAQLSRARKKAYMEDLKIENARLQKLVDILDSQPELVFSVNVDGHITYMSERTAYFIKSSCSADESVDEDPTHMNQILTPESLETFLEAVREVAHSSTDNSIGSVHMETGNGISAVREVCFHDASGYPAIGYLRCARVIRRAPLDEQVGEGIVEHVPPAKRSKKNDDVIGGLDGSVTIGGRAVSSSSADATLATAAILQSLQSMTSSAWIKQPAEKADSDGQDGVGLLSGSSLVGAASSSPEQAEEEEHEFVCVIRPAEASTPQGALNCYPSYSSTLSTASMVQHDRTHVTKEGQHNERSGSPSDSSSNRSTDKSGTTSSSSSGISNKNGTSSETGSEDNGENDSV